MTNLGILEHGDDPAFIAAPDGTLVESNRSFEKLFELSGTSEKPNLADIWQEINQYWESAKAGIRDGNQPRLDILARLSDGRKLVFDTRFFAIENSPNSNGLIAVVARDVTTERARTTQLEHKATTDPLTGVYNREQLEILLTQAISTARRSKSNGCFVYLDIDNFKKINDSLGHNAGDQALVDVCAVLKANLRESDAVGRLGGDEFGIILNNANQNAGSRKATQLAEILTNQVTLGEDLQLETSVGIAEFPSNQESASEIIRRADNAMYSAKRDSRS